MDQCFPKELLINIQWNDERGMVLGFKASMLAVIELFAKMDDPEDCFSADQQPLVNESDVR